MQLIELEIWFGCQLCAFWGKEYLLKVAVLKKLIILKFNKANKIFDLFLMNLFYPYRLLCWNIGKSYSIKNFKQEIDNRSSQISTPTTDLLLKLSLNNTEVLTKSKLKSLKDFVSKVKLGRQKCGAIIILICNLSFLYNTRTAQV